MLTETLKYPLMTQSQKIQIEETVQKERKRLFNFIRLRVPEKEDAEDILQDVFYQLIEGYHAIESLEKITSWLFRVARNKITDRYRKKKPLRFSDLTQNTKDENESSPLMLTDILPDLSGSPDEHMARELIWAELEAALEELPPEQKEVFVMHEFEDKSFKEIAEITGETQNTLFSRKRYAILHLRKRLKNLYKEMIYSS